ncbi:hypothetical protein SDC9_183720 [bioreactor metagenome]|uniref:Uncharacterized protein n=1 Tax=bioreactor metagenome TaxID=1076179 RepID=A0A645HCW6_9ZZZZ
MPERQYQAMVFVWRTKTINAGNTGHDNNITAFKQRACRRVAQLIYLIINRGVFFNKSIGVSNISLGLVIVIIADEILNRIIRKKLFELAG